MTKKQNLLVVTPMLGAFSEVWLWRQVIGINNFSPTVLTWQYVNREKFPIPGIAVRTLELDFNRRDSVIDKVFKRLRGLASGNFCGPSQVEQALLKEYLAESRPDVILCHFGFTALRIIPHAQQFNIPLVVHFHGLDLSSVLRNKWYRWSLKKALKQFTAVVVVGKHQYDWMIQHGYKKDKLFLIPCGVPTENFTPLFKQTTEHEESICYIAVSRLTEKKGLPYTLRAFKKVTLSLPDSRLTIVGDGPLRNELIDLTRRLGLENNVKFTGAVGPERVTELLSESDVFVQHSIIASTGDMEGSPVAIAEASAAGLPVITTSGSGGTEELIRDGETGFLIGQKDTDSMAEAMTLLAQQPLKRRKMGKAGYYHMKSNFDTSQQITLLESALLKSIDNSNI